VRGGFGYCRRWGGGEGGLVGGGYGGGGGVCGKGAWVGGGGSDARFQMTEVAKLGKREVKALKDSTEVIGPQDHI